ncbi:hypothetical protein SPI_08376 [Niveomyces insectorum RCEF 264]|uniref:Uncharacterized protein n=1 Tax=Niveomyces insectorum RCEF 264 TaxID=1081102 RepID=A0A167N968_9HYPO|nr:hypothetical protein SPI_08376 [Niveomyces insectorum RCEF 264]
MSLSVTSFDPTSSSTTAVLSETTATVTSLLALTTPFAQAPSCTAIFSATTIVYSDWRDDYAKSGLSIESIVSPACFRGAPTATSMTTTTTPDNAATTASALFPTSLQVHDAWHISWASADVSTLSPPPPTLTCGTALSSWVPGAAVPTASSCVDDNAASYNSGVSMAPQLIWLMAAMTF